MRMREWTGKALINGNYHSHITLFFHFFKLVYVSFCCFLELFVVFLLSYFEDVLLLVRAGSCYAMVLYQIRVYQLKPHSSSRLK